MNPQSLIFMVLMIAVMYLVLFRPQQRRIRQHQELIKSLEVGDHVVTIGGIHGVVRELGDETIKLDLGGGTVITFGRGAVANKVTRVDDAPDDENGQDVDGRGIG